jgi:hypothetical protein
MTVIRLKHVAFTDEFNKSVIFYGNGKAIPVQASKGPEAHRFQGNQNMNVEGCQTYAMVTFTPQENSWCSCLLEAELTPGS